LAVPGIASSASYEADGQTRQIDYTNGVKTIFSYDPERRWLDRVNTANPAGTLILLDYLRNNVGDISSVTSSRAGESWTYTYDSISRLVLRYLRPQLRDRRKREPQAGQPILSRLKDSQPHVTCQARRGALHR
jgi:hypothetical protein